MRVAVIGGSQITDAEYETARTVGRRLAEHEHEVICGGRTGVMEAVCRGANELGGHTIGILPGHDPDAANEYVETAIATGMGNARNVLVVLNSDAVIAIDGQPARSRNSATHSILTNPSLASTHTISPQSRASRRSKQRRKLSNRSNDGVMPDTIG